MSCIYMLYDIDTIDVVHETPFETSHIIKKMFRDFILHTLKSRQNADFVVTTMVSS